jgi:hypothetical protein
MFLVGVGLVALLKFGKDISYARLVFDEEVRGLVNCSENMLLNSCNICTIDLIFVHILLVCLTPKG